MINEHKMTLLIGFSGFREKQGEEMDMERTNSVAFRLDSNYISARNIQRNSRRDCEQSEQVPTWQQIAGNILDVQAVQVTSSAVHRSLVHNRMALGSGACSENRSSSRMLRWLRCTCHFMLQGRRPQPVIQSEDVEHGPLALDDTNNSSYHG